ncbi:hypothetical protein LTR48_009395, partial [Friedmanniomyces endolithicus]
PLTAFLDRLDHDDLIVQQQQIEEDDGEMLVSMRLRVLLVAKKDARARDVLSDLVKAEDAPRLV